MENPNAVISNGAISKKKVFAEFVDERNLQLQGEKLSEVSNKIVKRTMDISAGIIGITTLIPITTLVYLSSRINNDRGPIFYSQERIGKDGKIFKMYKYRTMVENADEVLDQILEEDETAKEEYGMYKKLRNDTRITKVGNFLRKTSLDELPQMINVLKGDMSLIGPRPYLPREKKDMGRYYKDIIKEKPGLTGYWQVNGRNDITFDERLKMEKYYVDNNSLKLDCKILAKTAISAVKRTGAM